MALDQTAVAYSSLAPGARTTGLSDGPERQRLFSGDQQAERLPGLGDVIDPERKITEAVARKPRGKDHGKQRPPHLHLACQIDSIHDAGKTDIRKDHRSEEHTSELQSLRHLVCRLLLEKKKKNKKNKEKKKEKKKKNKNNKGRKCKINNTRTYQTHIIEV